MPTFDPSQASIPEIFLCPITRDVMKDPVCDSEGNSFERHAIESWLQSHGTSPITRSVMTVSALVPNRVLKDAIESFLKGTVPGAAAASANVIDCPIDFSDYVGSHDEISRLSVRAIPVPQGYLHSIDGTHENYHLVHVKVIPSDGTSRGPVDVSCVIDISGSMGTEATLQSATTGNSESFGLSILDIVKHSVSTIVMSLTKYDRLAIVSFSDTSKIELPLTNMDDPGQKKALETLKKLEPTNSTNLWAGIKSGLQVLHDGVKDNIDAAPFKRLASTLVFTDGIPNIIPPMGHLQTLRNYRERTGKGSLPGTINTFGFGYNLESETLYELAKEGQGSYAFIPDSAFVGTIFVHAVANLTCTMARNVRVSLSLPAGPVSIVKPESASLITSYFGQAFGYETNEDDLGGISFDIGSLQYGQSRDVVLLVKGLAQASPSQSIMVKVEASTRSSDGISLTKDFTVSEILAAGLESMEVKEEAMYHHTRLSFVDFVKSALASKSPEGGANGVLALLERVRLFSSPTSTSKSTLDQQAFAALIQDISGQTTEAFRPDYFERWGKHYLPSLRYAHLNQVCNNFKDPGVQNYGGKLFQDMRNIADEIFCNLPPPTTKRPAFKETYHSSSTSAAYAAHAPAPAAAPTFSMSMFYDRNGVCFGEKCWVLSQDTKVEMNSLKKGDFITAMRISDESLVDVKILCITVQESHDGKPFEMIQMPGSELVISPWHPIFQDNQWTFPSQAESTEMCTVNRLFNIFLERQESPVAILVNGIPSVTLGHGIIKGACQHDYFSSWDSVYSDLSRLSGFHDKGKVFISGVLRSRKTGLITGIISHEE